MFIIITSFAASLFFTALATTSTQVLQTCTLPNITEDGICVPIISCPAVKPYVMDRNYQYLDKLRCGFEGTTPLICCPLHEDNDQIKFILTEEATPRAITRSSIKPTLSPVSSPVEASSTPYVNEESRTSTEKSTNVTNTTHLPDISADFSLGPPLTIENFGERQPEYGISDNVANFQPRPTSKKPVSVPELSEKEQKLLLLPDRKTCGDNTLITERIYGGDLAGLSEFPWIAQIRGKHIISGKEVYLCAGTLINNRYVLTAAHCVIDKVPISFVRLGEWDTETTKDCDSVYCNDPPVDRAVEKAIKYPRGGHVERDLRDDIALLRLQEPVNFTEFIKPICLPTTDYVIGQDYVPESMYVTAGWGRTESSKASAVLQKAEVPAVNVNICRVAVPAVPADLFPYVICAGGRKGVDSCVGDSGGGLYKAVREEKQTNWYIFGITSYGSGRCGSEGIPSIYTRVISFMDWIISELNP